MRSSASDSVAASTEKVVAPPTQSLRSAGTVTSIDISGFQQPGLDGGDARELAGKLAPAVAAIDRVEHLAHRGAEVDARRVERIDVERIAQHAHVVRRLRQAVSHGMPARAAVGGAVDADPAAHGHTTLV